MERRGGVPSTSGITVQSSNSEKKKQGGKKQTNNNLIRCWGLLRSCEYDSLYMFNCIIVSCTIHMWKFTIYQRVECINCDLLFSRQQNFWHITFSENNQM